MKRSTNGLRTCHHVTFPPIVARHDRVVGDMLRPPHPANDRFGPAQTVRAAA